MLLLDLTHTSHTQARTGVQRVCRELYAALARQQAVLALTHDPHARHWRPLEPWEEANLSPVGTTAAAARGASWPRVARWRGTFRRWRGAPAPALPPAPGGLVVPEIFSPAVATALPALFARVTGPRVALFHDAIALQLPHLTPPKSVARFPAYLAELARFDGIATVSADSRNVLLRHWQENAVAHPPPVVALPLGLAPLTPAAVAAPPPDPAPATPPVVLCVGSIEGRKNHLALLTAAETLWTEGLRFSLRLIGLAHPLTGRAALDRVRALQAAGRPLCYDGPVDDATLTAAYASCAFTVYPSLLEGFGLPILESLQHAKPCLCSDRGALGESAAGGGCLTVTTPDAPALTAGLRRLLTETDLRVTLTAAARARRFRTWEDYATDLQAWMALLPRRA